MEVIKTAEPAAKRTNIPWKKAEQVALRKAVSEQGREKGFAAFCLAYPARTLNSAITMYSKLTNKKSPKARTRKAYTRRADHVSPELKTAGKEAWVRSMLNSITITENTEMTLKGNTLTIVFAE